MADRDVTRPGRGLGKAAGYARVSTDEQADRGLSLAEQQRLIAERCDHEGWSLDLYVDAALSGARSDRAELKRLLARIDEYDYVVVWKIDRLARKTVLMAEILETIQANGVALISLTEPIDGSTPMGRAALEMMAVFSQLEREHIRERTRVGKAASARAGRRNGGPRPYGYGQADGALSIVPHEAEIVRRVYREYVGGRSQAEIARGLNSDGIKTVRGAPWCQQRIRDLLGNRLYVGFVRNGEDEYPGAHEPIVATGVWMQAAELRSAKRRTPTGWRARPTVGTHLFVNGMLRCGSCGSPMLPRSPRNEQGVVREFYVCGGWKYGKADCPTKRVIQRGEIDSAVLQYFLTVGLDYEATRQHFEQRAKREIAATVAMLAHAEAEERRADARIKRVTRDYRDGVLSAKDWRDHMDELEPERDAASAEAARLRARRAEIEAQVVAATSDGEGETLRYLADLREAILGTVRDADGVSAVRAALLRLFDRFIFHHTDSEKFPGRVYADLAFLGNAGEYAIEPVVREDVIEGYLERGTPILRRSGLLGETSESEEIQAASGR